MATALCDLDDVREYLGLTVSQTADDTLITRCVNTANEYIERATGRIFADPGSDATRYFRKADVDRNGVLRLDADLLSVTTLTNADESATEITSANYELLPLNGTPKRAIRIPDSSSVYWDFFYNDSKISVLGRWAYSSTVPYDIQQAAIRLASSIYRQKDTNADIDRPILTGDGNLIMPARLPQDIQELIAGYRIPYV